MPDGVRRVLLLGPSHSAYLAGCAVSGCDAYATPAGDITVDGPARAALLATGQFETMDLAVDEREHSLEMHLPYIAHAMGERPYTLVPIMVGALSESAEARYGKPPSMVDTVANVGGVAVGAATFAAAMQGYDRYMALVSARNARGRRVNRVNRNPSSRSQRRDL